MWPLGLLFNLSMSTCQCNASSLICQCQCVNALTVFLNLSMCQCQRVDSVTVFFNLSMSMCRCIDFFFFYCVANYNVQWFSTRDLQPELFIPFTPVEPIQGGSTLKKNHISLIWFLDPLPSWSTYEAYTYAVGWRKNS
jgi:hypothetical protein